MKGSKENVATKTAERNPQMAQGNGPPGEQESAAPSGSLGASPVSNQPTELVLTRSIPHGGELATPIEGGLIASWNDRQGQWQASFSDATIEGFNLRMKCLGKEDHKLMTLPGQPIIVKDWFLHQVKVTDQQTGEIFETLRLILVDPAGNTISTCSLPFCSNWGDVVSRFGKATLNPYLRIKVKLVPGKQMGHFPQLDWVEPLTPGEMAAYQA